MTSFKPDYYKDENGMDLFDEIERKYTKDEVVSIYGFNIKKYVKRFQKKNGMEDLLKARDYVSRLQKYLGDDSSKALGKKLLDMTTKYQSLLDDISMVSMAVDRIVGKCDDSDNDEMEFHNTCLHEPIINTDLDDNDVKEILNEIESIVEEWFDRFTMINMISDSDTIKAFKHIKEQYDIKSIYGFVNYEYDCGNLSDTLIDAFSNTFKDDAEFGDTRLCDYLKKADEE